MDLKFFSEAFLEVLRGVPNTFFLAFVSLILGLALGLFLALVRIYRVRVLTPLANFYVSFLRGVPTLVLLYVSYFTIPHLLSVLNDEHGFRFPVEPSSMALAVIALTVHASAFCSEIFRSAFNAVSANQMEAAYSVGMTPAQSLWRILLPQMAVVALPNIENQFLSLLKSTSLAFMVGVSEIMSFADKVALVQYRYLETYIVVAVLYWLLCISAERVFLALNRRFSYPRRHKQSAFAPSEAGAALAKENSYSKANT